MFWDSSVNRPRKMSLPQLPPWAQPRGQLGSRAQLVRPRGGVYGTDAIQDPLSVWADSPGPPVLFFSQVSPCSTHFFLTLLLSLSD